MVAAVLLLLLLLNLPTFLRSAGEYFKNVNVLFQINITIYMCVRN